MDNWVLKECSDLNRMLKVKTDLEHIEKDDYPYLITISHKYATSDDILFPEPTTLGFFATFEQKCLLNLSNGIYVAQDIYTGMLNTYIYSKEDYNKTILETISFLKLKPEYHVEFHVQNDPTWKLLPTRINI
jgi:hypothetical protein